MSQTPEQRAVVNGRSWPIAAIRRVSFGAADTPPKPPPMTTISVAASLAWS
jgi:hypothetical protein